MRKTTKNNTYSTRIFIAGFGNYNSYSHNQILATYLEQNKQKNYSRIQIVICEIITCWYYLIMYFKNSKIHDSEFGN